MKIKNCWFVLCCYVAMSLCRSNLSATSLLKDISIKSEANKDTVSVVVSSKTKYNIFRIDKPNRLVIELNDCEYATDKKNIAANTQFIKGIRGAQYKETPIKKSRIVVDLNKSVSYSAKSTNNEIQMKLTERKITVIKPKSKPVVKSTTTATVPVQKPAPVKPPESETVKPQEVVKSTETAKPEVAVKPVAAKQSFIKPNIPDKKHLATVKKIKETEKQQATSNKQQVKKEEPKKSQQKQDTIKTGTLPKDPVTLDFTDADIKDVLQILAVKTGMNIIYNDDVTGTLSLHLESVPFDEAMNLILQMKGLVLQQVASNVLRVMTPATLTKERADSVQVTQIYRLNYSKASDISGKLTSIMSAESQKVTVQTDERTNSIIVTSTPEGLLSAASLINKLDVKPEQVLIEAKIVEIIVSDAKDLGIEWELAKGNQGINDTVIGLTNPGRVYGRNSPDATEVVTAAGGGTGVSAPPQSRVGGFSFGYIKSDIALTARLAAAQTKGNAKLLSQPRIATLNNMEAKIVVGDLIPYTQTTVTTAGSTQSTAFMTVGIQLTVTPTINADGRITMKVKPEVSYVTEMVVGVGPRTSTRNAETTVLVKNGETIVIGGMISDQERKGVSQVPLLGDLPLLGHFFKSQHSDKTKTELLIFLTPYIMNE